MGSPAAVASLAAAILCTTGCLSRRKGQVGVKLGLGLVWTCSLHAFLDSLSIVDLLRVACQQPGASQLCKQLQLSPSHADNADLHPWQPCRRQKAGK